MPDKPLSKSDKMLARAYALKSESETKALYRDWATTYEATMLDGLCYLTPQNTAQLLNRYLEDKTAKILDVGCGTGLAGKALVQLGFTIIDALDFSAEMLAVAKSHKIYENLIEADLNKKLAIADANYDALICTGTFTHAHVGADCLDDLFRILKPNGLFGCTVQKNLWHSAGFEKKLNALQESGAVKMLHQQLGEYFETSTEPDGWYLVLQKL